MVSRWTRRAVGPLGVAFLVLAAGAAAPATKKAQGSNVKRSLRPAPHKLGAIGTAQLPGEWCEFGKAYTLGNRAQKNAMNVTLTGAEYTIGHVDVGKRSFWPMEGEKLLVIHYLLHNPLPLEQKVQHNTITWTAVDGSGKDKNQEYLGVGVDDANKAELDQSLKPAQKIKVFAVIRVDAYSPVTKLMAARYEVPAPVARYDLKGKIKPLEAPYADPADPTGATVAKKVPGVIGTAYMTGNFLTKVEKIEFADPPILGTGPGAEGFDKGDAYVLVTLACTYLTDEGRGGAGGSQAPTSNMKLVDDGGVSYKPRYNAIHPTANKTFEPQIDRGDTGKYRVLFEVPKGTQLKTLTLKEFSGLPIVIDVSAYKVP